MKRFTHKGQRCVLVLKRWISIVCYEKQTDRRSILFSEAKTYFNLRYARWYTYLPLSADKTHSCFRIIGYPVRFEQPGLCPALPFYFKRAFVSFLETNRLFTRQPPSASAGLSYSTLALRHDNSYLFVSRIISETNSLASDGLTRP